MMSLRVLFVVLLCASYCYAVPNLALSRSPSSVLENTTDTIVYTVTRTSSLTGDITAIIILGGTAERTVDYTLAGSSTLDVGGTFANLTMPDGSSSETITLTPIDNNVVEDDRTVEMSLQTSMEYLSVGTVISSTIQSEDRGVVTVVAGATDALEGDAVNVRFTITNSRDVVVPVTALLSGTVDLTSDFTLSSAGTFSFDDNTGLLSFSYAVGTGSGIFDILVTFTNDNIGENDKDLVITVQPDSGDYYVVGSPDEVSIALADTDTPSVYVTIDPTSLVESSGDTFHILFSREGNNTDTETLTTLFSLNGTAVAGVDYSVSPSGALFANKTAGTLQFGVGETEVWVNLTVIDNNEFGVDKTIDVYVVDAAGFNVLSSLPVQATILNDDVEVFLDVAPASVVEGATDPTLVFTFTRVGLNTGDLSVDFDVSGTATFNVDYTVAGADSFSASSGSVTIAAGNDTATVRVTAVDDTNVENDETVSLRLAAGTGYEIGTNETVSGIIENDDENGVSLSASPTAVRENSGQSFLYVFTRNGDVSNAITVSFSVGGSAGISGVGGTDYVESGAATFSATSGTIVIPASSFSANLRLTPVGDSTFEGNETISIQLQPGSAYTIETPNAVVVTIINDDSGTSTVSLTGSPMAVFENPSTPMRLTFTRTGDTSRSLTVPFSVSGTARFGVDYTEAGASTFGEVTGEVLFLAGTRNVEVDLVPVANQNVDDDRTVIISLLSGSNYLVSVSANSFTGMILDDDVVTQNNLEPVVTAASGFQYFALKLRTDLEFPDDPSQIIKLLRVDISNFLSISSKYVEVAEVYLENAECRIFSVPDVASGFELAERLILAINSGDIIFVGTPLEGAYGFLVSATFADPYTFQQDFGVNDNLLQDLIGTVPEVDPMIMYVVEENKGAAATLIASSLSMLLFIALALF